MMSGMLKLTAITIAVAAFLGAKPSLAISAAAGQSTTLSARGRSGRGAPPAPVQSPEVHADRTVTFRLRAPKATAVDLVGEVLQGKPPMPMTKDDKGIWSVTIGPVDPEIWSYDFSVEGVQLPDPENISLMTRASGAASVSSFVEVPGDSPAFYDARPVPHGQVRMLLYESKAMGNVDRYVWVYTPPGYDKSNSKYPVLYLLHGNGETQAGWVDNGRANIILDNLIAEHKAVPMIVVMPHGHARQSASVGPYEAVEQLGDRNWMDFTLFSKDLIDQIIPLVQRDFRVYTDADDRAIGGLSMGAMQSIQIGLTHLDLFHYVLVYSGLALGPQPSGDIEMQSPWKELLANSEQTKKNLHLLFLGAGTKETAMHGPGQRLVELFKQKGINAIWAEYPGAHVWRVWRNDLNYTVPMLFHTQASASRKP